MLQGTTPYEASPVSPSAGPASEGCELLGQLLRQAARRGHVREQRCRTSRHDTLLYQQIGVLGVRTEQSEQVFPDLLDGIGDALADLGLGLQFVYATQQELADPVVVATLRDRFRVDGLLLPIHSPLPECLPRALNQTETPWVSIYSHACYATRCVHAASSSAARSLTRMLIRWGHRNISYIDLAVSDHCSNLQRRIGYEKEARNHRILPQHLPLIRGTRPEQVQQALSWLRAARPTAVIAGCTRSAEIVHEAARHLGLTMPKELSLATFACRGEPPEIPFCRMDLSLYQMGRAGVEMLMQSLRRPEIPLLTWLMPFWLVPGETVGPAPQETA